METHMKRYSLPDLPYDYSALEPHYSGKVLELHHGKHHAAYVSGANATLDKLAEARETKDFAALNQLQKSLAFHVSGHVLHSLFWKNMTPPLISDGGLTSVRSWKPARVAAWVSISPGFFSPSPASPATRMTSATRDLAGWLAAVFGDASTATTVPSLLN